MEHAPTATIVKHRSGGVAPNLERYAAADPEAFWAEARAELAGLPGGRGLNIAYEAVDRHLAGPLGDRVALRFIARDGARHDYTYADLARETSRFANMLRGLGVAPGDLVCSLAGRIPQLYIAALGTLKARSVFSPLFSAFGPEPIRTRLELGRARVLVTTEALYRRKVKALRPSLPDLEHVLLVGERGEATAVDDTHDLARLLRAASDDFTIEPTDPEDSALVHFTSGTTGKPKAARHVHGAVVAHHVTAKLALDLHPDDIFWCTADPGWVTGTSYGIIGPLTSSRGVRRRVACARE
jgi:acetyl-CoA synthetase